LKISLNPLQIVSNFDQSKNDLPKLKKFEIKCGYQDHEERNNFIDKNFSRLEVDFK
jgi:hypothetical protein